MSAEAASPEPARQVGVVLPAGDGTRAVTASRATTVTVFGVLAVGMSAFDSIARNLALPDIIKVVHSFLNAPGFLLALSATFFEFYHHIGIGPLSLSVTLEGVGCIAGSLLLGLVSRGFRSRDLLITFVLAGAVVLGLFSLQGGAAQILVLMTLYGFLGQGALGVWARYIVESYPTRMRGTASGFVMGFFFFFFFLISTAALIMFGDLIDAKLYVLAASLSAIISFCGGIVMVAGRRHAIDAELEELAV